MADATGATVDTSSYPKGQLPVSPLDLAGKLGAIQQQKLSIDQAKLDQANQGLTYLARAVSALGPNATEDQYRQAGDQVTRQLGLPPEKTAIWNEQVDAAKTPDGKFDSQGFFKHAMSQIASHSEILKLQTGTDADKNDNSVNYQGKVDPLTGGFKPATGMPVQIPPGTVGYDTNNKQQFQQPSGPSGVVPVPQRRPGLPVQPINPPAAPAAVSGATGPTVDQTPNTPTTFNNRMAPLAAGPDPLFSEGKEAYTRDQLSASARSQAIKPAIDALKLMPGLSTGPGTSQYTDLVAAAKAWGIVDTKAENDPTVLRQEIEKKLAQYVGSSPIGQRSDAAQTLAEAGSPNPKKQILPALQSLTRDAVALDRVNILKPQAFNGSDYQNYIKHQGTFPQGIDQKALTLDMLPEKEREDLVKKMANQYKNGNAAEKRAANKFLDTFTLATKKGIYE